MIKLILAEIGDPAVSRERKDKFIQDDLKRLQDYLRADVFGKSQFSFFEHTFNGPVVKYKSPHGLSYKPIDIIQLSVTQVDTSTITWHYDSFDATNLVISASGACTVRAFVGRYGENL